MSAADLTVIVVNWNTVDLLDDCLKSILDYRSKNLRQEIVVVDNASKDGSIEHLAATWPSITVISNDDNVGFCRANNQAILATSSPYLLLLNTDARLTAGCIDTMLGYLNRDERTAVVGARLVYADGKFQRWTAGQPLSLRSYANYLLGLDRFATHFPALSSMYLHHDTALPFTPGWVSSAVMLVRRQALDEIGLFDESIFVYMDDVDLCQRASDAGWRTWYAADTTAIHFMGASSKRSTGSSSPEALRALNRWFERRHGRRSALAMRALETLGFGARAGFYSIKGLLGTDDAVRSRGREHWNRVKSCLEPADA